MNYTVLEQIVESGGPTPDEYALLDHMLQQLAVLPPDELVTAVQSVRAVLAPTLTSETMQGFALLKPHGYPGDFEIIDRIYQRWTSPRDDLARWDHYFHQHAAPTAVRNRRDYFISIVKELDPRPAHILDLASGPARDLLELLETSEAEHFFTCLDIDPAALDYSRELCAPFASRIDFRQGNALTFRTSEKYDLVWSGGLFDYFTDRVFVTALKRLLRLLAPGGECVIGNFSTSNPSRPYMELVGDWRLIHRTEQQLRNLALDAGVGSSQIAVDQEPLGVNLFLRIKTE